MCVFAVSVDLGLRLCCCWLDLWVGWICGWWLVGWLDVETTHTPYAYDLLLLLPVEGEKGVVSSNP